MVLKSIMPREKLKIDLDPLSRYLSTDGKAEHVEAECIRIQLGERYADFVDLKIENGKLQLMAGHSINVEPNVSNSISIVFREPR
jgi:hypothetical protein